MRERQQHVQGLLAVLACGMRHDLLFAHSGDELRGVVAFVGAHRLRREAAIAQFDHLVHGHGRFRRADGRLHLEQHAQAVAVLHRGMAGEAQARLLARAFFHELGLGVGGRGVGVVAALFAFEVRPRVAPARPLIVVLRAKTFQGRPRFDQRAIGR